MVDKSDFIELTRKLAHDMRVPLNTIISTSDMLLQGVYDPLTPRQEKSVTRLQRNNHRLVAILDDFTTYIKADAGELILNPKPFDPRAHLELWCQPVREAMEEKGLEFHVTTTESVPAAINADEALLKRIVQAVLWNAFAHTSEGGIEITSEWAAENHWLLSIQDSGSGISNDDLPHIFEPFWRGEERPQLPTAAAGLGLPMSLAIARAMGGNLFLKEMALQGCNFCIQIPVEN